MRAGQQPRGPQVLRAPLRGRGRCSGEARCPQRLSRRRVASPAPGRQGPAARSTARCPARCSRWPQRPDRPGASPGQSALRPVPDPRRGPSRSRAKRSVAGGNEPVPGAAATDSVTRGDGTHVAQVDVEHGADVRGQVRDDDGAQPEVAEKPGEDGPERQAPDHGSYGDRPSGRGGLRGTPGGRARFPGGRLRQPRPQGEGAPCTCGASEDTMCSFSLTLMHG